MGIDPDLVIPNKGLSVYDDCIAPWRGQKLKKYKQLLIENANQFDFPIHRPYYKLSNEQQDLIWTGNDHFCLLYTSPSPRDATLSRMPSSA